MDGPLTQRSEKAEAANTDIVRAAMNTVRNAKAGTTMAVLIKAVETA